ncbi:hypothetical protein [Paracoccus sp. Z118]|uniref:hypothetical protein n=1 Tax=Paracoccus sp. Z118 TaxID=2851017 RepID=UPI0020B7B7E9|nr:hypothetical protein [Paracoccus sp. Z118]
MNKFGVALAFGLTLGVAACGDNPTERAVTGATTGAVVAGPVGAAVGGVAGGTGAVQVNP